MLCILHMIGGEIAGWLIATDIEDARLKAQAAGHTQLAATLYQAPTHFRPGRYDLGGKYLLLVG
jgi:hypothetical protein